MHILSEGVPMTNGEAYALLRRRRDERSAAAHQPFGLQRAQADPHGRTSNQAIQYGRSGGGGGGGARLGEAAGADRPTDGIQRQAVATAAGAGSGGPSGLPPTAADVDAMNALLASPAAGHLAVLLTEVRVLHYLAQHTAVGDDETGSTERSMKSLYGPSTVYDLSVAPEEESEGSSGAGKKFGKEEEEEGEEAHPVVKQEEGTHNAHGSTHARAMKRQSAAAAAAGEEEGSAAAHHHTACLAHKEALAAESLMQDAITHTLVGTNRHVRCVGCALAYYEAKGRGQERAWAQAIRAIAAEARPVHGSAGRATANTRRGADEEEEKEANLLRSPNSGVNGGRFMVRRGSNASDRSAGNPAAAPEGGGSNTGSTSHLHRQRSAALARYDASSSAVPGRPLLNRPPNLVAMATEDAFFPIPVGPQSSLHPSLQGDGVTATPHGAAPLLTETEVMSLVMGRPSTRLQVHQLLDNLDSRFGGDEAAVDAFVNRVMAVFRA